MLDESTLYAFALSCARNYCQRFASSDLDDATQEASLYLLQIRDKWNRPRNYLRKRVIFELVRRYQDKHGLRRKNKPQFIDADLFRLTTQERKETEAERDAREIVATAIQDSRLETEREIVELIVDGWTNHEIVEFIGRPYYEISAIRARFLRAVRNVCGTPADEKERNRFPLLYLGQE